MQIILATANPDKVSEINAIMQDQRISFVTMKDAGFSGDIIENGDSFAENALIKARAVHKHAGGTVLADDSGLAVDLLDGAPGIYSARFAGENADYLTKIAKLQDMLSTWPPNQWHASFICVMALIEPDGRTKTFRGQCRGIITKEALGENGFGYDPVFYVPHLGKTMAQLQPAEKHAISHRGQALQAVSVYLHQLLDQNEIR